MKRAALYSSRGRSGDQAAPGAGQAPPDGTGDDVRQPVRGRLRAYYRRHEGPLLFAAGLSIAALAGLIYTQSRPEQREFSQEDIDAAVLHTLDNKTLPSRAAKAAELVRESVVRVNGFDDDEKDAGDTADSKDGKDSKGAKDKASNDAKPSRDAKNAPAGKGGGGDGRSAKNSKDGRASKSARDNGDDGAGKSARNSRDSKDSKDSKDSRNSKDPGDGKDKNARNGDSPEHPEGMEKHRRVGSGVVIVDNGTILTNLHVVAGAKRLTVTFYDGMESEAEVIAAQPENDLAVIRAKKIPDDLPSATLGSSLRLRPGDDVVAVGFPFGIGPSVSAGVVSGLDRGFKSADGKRKLSRLIQFDAAVNPGNSGGPLITMDGEVVGIVTAIFNPTEQRTFIGIGFAATIEAAGAAVGVPPF